MVMEPNTPPQGRSRALPDAQRLKRQRLIRPLFDRDRDDVGAVARGAIRIVYRILARTEAGVSVPLQVGFAPGRRARTHVERNRIKRLLREVYRHHRHALDDLLSAHPEQVLVMMILFRGEPSAAGEAIPIDLPAAFQVLQTKIQEGFFPA
jgi:ribonuclease P protein component